MSTCASPCPLSCPYGYAPGTAWTSSGCTVYCEQRPTNGQCDVGGSGCTSSCYSAPSSPTAQPTATSCTSPCPLTCPNGYASGGAWTLDGCTVYCDQQPVNGECATGGTGCTSSCNPASTNSNGIGLSNTELIGGLAGVGAVVVVLLLYFYKTKCRSKSDVEKERMINKSPGSFSDAI